MKAVLLLFAATLLSSCVGVRKVGTLVIEDRTTEFRAQLPARAHGLSLFIDRKYKQDANGFLLNRGKQPFCVHRLVYPQRQTHPSFYVTSSSEKIWIAPGEEKKIFTGPLHLLKISFGNYKGGRRSFTYRIELDSPPPEVIKARAQYSYGSP